MSLAPAGPSVHGELTFDRIALEALAPELAALGDGRGIATGRVAIDIAPGQPLAVDVLLPELWLSIARAVEGADGETTVQRVRVEAARPIHVTVRGQTASTSTRRSFATDGGDLRVARAARRHTRQLAGDVSGHLDLELLQPFLGASARQAVRRSRGRARRRRDAGQARSCAATVDVINAVTVRPARLDRDFVIGGGLVHARQRRRARRSDSRSPSTARR